MDVSRLSGRRLLVADDDRDSAEGLASMLRLALRCEVDIAYDGAQAVRQALQQRPQAVILDLQMPRLDGVAAARGLREAFPGRPPFIVAVSGDAEALARLDDGPFDRTFVKPVDLERLMMALLDGAC